MATTFFACGRRKGMPRRATWALTAPVIVAAGLTVCAPAAMAWDGTVTGTITALDSVANEANNYELRVYVSGASVYCTTTATYAQGFAYMNSGDVNFKGMLAVLLTAYSTGKQVTLFMMNDASAGCHLHYAQVR